MTGYGITDRRPEHINRDPIEHPEKYYCPVCGASFVSHEVPCEPETKVLFINDESEDELTAEELAMTGAKFLASHNQKAIYQERAELCLQSAREAEKVAAELYQQVLASQAEGAMPDPVVYDHWLEMVHASAFWTREWLAYLDMIKAIETK